MSQFIEQLGTWVSPWIYGPVIFVLWILILNLTKAFLFSRIKNAAQKTKFRFDDLVIEAARFPVTILIFGSGLYILQLLLPLEQKIEHAVSVATQASVVFSIVLFFDGLIRESSKTYSGRPEFAFASKGITQGLIRGGIIGIGVLIFLDMLGISITPILASLGIGSLAVALALQDTLTNFFAGIYITIDKPVRVGDFVKLESGDAGHVLEIGWRSTRIQTLPDKIVIVPNQKLMSSIISNYNLPTQEVNVVVAVGVHYDSNLKKVEEITIDVAKQIMRTAKGGVSNFEPQVHYHTLDASSINFNVILRGKEFTDQHIIKHEFIKALHERYKKEGIVIPYPIRTLDIPAAVSETLKNR